MQLSFIGQSVDIKLLTIGTVLFYSTDFSDKLNTEKVLPCHLVGFTKSEYNELILRLDILGEIREVHPANTWFELDNPDAFGF